MTTGEEDMWNVCKLLIVLSSIYKATPNIVGAFTSSQTKTTPHKHFELGLTADTKC
jgi:hypothetical protein